MSPKAHSYDHLIAFALGSPWAIEPEMLAVIANILGRRIAGEDTHLEAHALGAPRERIASSGGVGVLSMHGTLAPRVNMLSEFSGGTTFEQSGAQLRELVAAKDVSTIVVDWDSPGGNVQGATEFAHEMLKARTVKPVISQVHHRMCSAAYWVGACATEIVATPSSVVGAIGVYAIHNDLSEALKQLGVKRSYLAKGKHKIDGNETEPLTDESRERWLAELEHPYATFLKDVAAGRGVPVATVRAGFGEGRAVQAEEALALGMIDRIATLDDTLARALSPGSSGSLVRAEKLIAPSQSPSEGDDPARKAARDWHTETARKLVQLAVS